MSVPPLIQPSSVQVIFASLYRNLAEFLEELLDLERCLASTSSGCLVSSELLVSVLSEYCICSIDLFN